MEKPVQWMTLQELRDELDRTRPAWEELANPDDVLESRQLPALGEDAHRHQLVQSELFRDRVAADLNRVRPPGRRRAGPAGGRMPALCRSCRRRSRRL